MFWPVLRAIQLLGGSGTRLHRQDQAVLMPDGRSQRLAYFCSWTLTRLKTGDLATNRAHGVWALTEHGQQATEAQVPALWHQVRAASRQRRAERPERALEQDEHGDGRRRQPG